MKKNKVVKSWHKEKKSEEKSWKTIARIILKCNMWFTSSFFIVPGLFILAAADVAGFIQIVSSVLKTDSGVSVAVSYVIVIGFTAAFELAPLYTGYILCLMSYGLLKPFDIDSSDQKDPGGQEVTSAQGASGAQEEQKPEKKPGKRLFAIRLRAYFKNHTVYDIMLWVSALAFLLGVIANTTLRLLTMGDMGDMDGGEEPTQAGSGEANKVMEGYGYPEQDPDSGELNSNHGESEGAAGNSVDVGSLGITITMILLPIITSFVNLVMGSFSFDPLLIDLWRLNRKLTALSKLKKTLEGQKKALGDNATHKKRCSDAENSSYNTATQSVKTNRDQLLVYTDACTATPDLNLSGRE